MDTNKSKSVVYSLFSTPLMISEEEYNLDEKELECIQNLKSNYTTGNENKRTVDSNILESFELSTLKQFCLKWINFYAHEFLSITDTLHPLFAKNTVSLIFLHSIFINFKV